MKVICNAGKKRDISPPLPSARLRFLRGADEEKGLLKQCMKSSGEECETYAPVSSFASLLH